MGVLDVFLQFVTDASAEAGTMRRREIDLLPDVEIVEVQRCT
jgi:hypothetical protein